MAATSYTARELRRVRSFSQIKYDLRDVDTFYLEPGDTRLGRRRTRSFHAADELRDEDYDRGGDADRVPDGADRADTPALQRSRAGSSAKPVSRSESAPSLEERRKGV
ncbi:hypothetical protein IscW_ISCW014916 [Ixodes scapularis]|uniref:Uncharacterized protein n=1 Tax=Ixodes scapularis TaxID=6945 RepID=B7QGK5_IXOSC|nr:hypothetical protein IscW_ISCW014916 [Ixodes scapularis]|eukprot:XP_002399821.1 hypothetical protein IscW_ISCW014916 [Ixodes scapularis]